MNMSSTRQIILKAAYQFVQREGGDRLTLDAVAHEAGLSKGGLLYHFPTKDALIGGMVAYLIDQFEGDLDRANAEEAPGPGSWLRAYIRASFNLPDEEIDGATALLAAVANNPSLLEPLRARYASWQTRTENDGVPAARATIIRLALDGLWFADLLDLAPPAGSLREQLITELLMLTHKPGENA